MDKAQWKRSKTADTFIAHASFLSLMFVFARQLNQNSSKYYNTRENN